MAVEKPHYCQVASNLDSHPKIRRAGPNGREVFLFALRRNAEPGNPVPGRLPAVMLEPWFVADQLMRSEAEAVDGIQKAELAGLLARDGASWLITGWEEHWGKRASSNAERQAKHRARRRIADSVTESNGAVTDRSLPNVTVTESNVSDYTRSDYTRGEDQKTPIVPKGDLASHRSATAVTRPRKSRAKKPLELADAERTSAMVVLGKLSARNGVNYTGCDEHVRLIANQLRAGVTEHDLRKVVGYCAVELGWSRKPEMAQYLRPETLFGPKNIARYLDPARAWFERLPAERHP